MQLSPYQLGILQSCSKDDAAFQQLVETFEATLQQAYDEFDDMAISIPGMIYRLHWYPDGTEIFEYISPNCMEINGISPSQLRKFGGLQPLTHPDDFAPFCDAHDATIHTPDPFQWDGRICVNGEWRWVRIQSNPTAQADGSIVWNGIETDITDLKNSEAALLRMEQMRLQQEAMRVAYEKEHELNRLRSEMMTRISHEFRTPLAVISTSAGLLKQYTDRLSLEKREAHLERIIQQVKHFTTLLESISLVVNREFRQPLAQFSPVNVATVCEDVIQQYRATSQQVNPIHFNPLTPNPIVQGNPDQLHRLFTHLLSNAVKYSPLDTPIRITLDDSDSGLLVAIHDEGIGILPEELPRVTEPFFRGSNFDERPGLGVGLTIARQAAETHGGKLHITSIPGRGTTIKVQLPC